MSHFISLFPLDENQKNERIAFDEMPFDFLSNDLDNDEAINGRHLNPTDFSLASDLPQLDPLDEEGEDPIMKAGGFAVFTTCPFFGLLE